MPVTVHDVTEGKEAEEALRESEERFRTQYKKLPMPTYSWRRVGDDFVLLDHNDAAYEFTEGRIAGFVGAKASEMLSARPSLVESMKRCFDEGATIREEMPQGYLAIEEGQPDDSRCLTVSFVFVPPDLVMVQTEDVTERKEAEAALKRSEERFRSLMQNSSDVVTVISADGTIVYQTPSMKRNLAHDPEDRIGKNIFTSPLIHPDDAAKQRNFIDQTISNPGLEPVFEVRLRHSDGSWRWVEGIVTNLLDHPSVGGIVLNSRDITERKWAEEALKRSESYLRTVVGNVPVVLFALNRDGVFTLSEGKGLQALGLRPGENVGRSVFEEYRDVPEIAENVRRTLGGEEVVATVEVGEVVFEVFYGPLRDEVGEVVGVIGVAADMTERRALEGRLRHQAYHDTLTGLPNRRLFVDRLGQSLRRTGRRPGLMAAVLFMDLDGFKVVNDSLGHEVGDRLLVAVAERVRGGLRPQDALARFGGDEFTVLVEDVEGPGDAARVAERIADSFGKPFSVGGQELFARFSIGIALGNACIKEPEELLRNADTAMYWAKEEGAAYRIFDPIMHERVVKIMEVENDLKRAVKAGEFVVHYQPIVDLRTEAAWGVEALVRWEHPERGLLNPAEFVAVAEENGLVVPMGEMVLEQACRSMANLQREQPRTPPLILSVNLSARQIRRHDLAETVERTLGESGLEARCLKLDITETNYVRALEGNTDALNRLRALGVGISIDDFGTGYSSLAYLKRLPADTLKIDKSFVAGLGEDIEDTAIVQMVIDLAHTFGMEVIAEGVESEYQGQQLKEMGCDHAQGFYFSKPLPPEALPGFLAR